MNRADTLETFITLVREPGGLIALVSRRQEELRFEPEALAQAFREQWNGSTIVRIPLEAVSASLVPRRERLLASWNALHAVRFPDSDTLLHVYRILLESGPGETTEDMPVSLPLVHPQEVKRVPPTAAHPRAYRGTKYKPPKPKLPEPADLTRHLCDSRNLNLLLTRLHSHHQAVCEQLAQEGYAVTAMAASESASDPYDLVYHASPEGLDVPHLFRTYLLPALRGRSRTEFAPYLTLYWQLALEQRPALLSALARLLGLQAGTNTLQWCRLLARLPEEQRLPFLALLVETEAYRCEAGTLSEREQEILTTLPNTPLTPYRLACLLSGLQKGVSLDYMATGFQLADAHTPNHAFHKIEQSGRFPQETVRRLVAHLRKKNRCQGTYDLTFWEHCGNLEGLADVLETVPWELYTPEDAHQYLWLYLNVKYHDVTEERRTAKWRFLRGQVGRIEYALARIPATYQRKAIDLLEEAFWYWDAVAELEAGLPCVYALMERLSQPPFKTKHSTRAALCHLLDGLDATLRRRLLAAPNASFLKLETACRRENDARLIEEGLWSLARCAPALSVESFCEQPMRLCKAAKLLGSLSDAQRNRVVATFDAEEKAGELSARLERLQQHTLYALTEGFEVDSTQDTIQHTLQIHRSSEGNRRAFRKFLKAYWSGQQDYLWTHPLTQEWIKRHPDLNIETWLRGIVYEIEDSDEGLVRIEMEQDPLEALKLGTYVGSCLGVGGICAYSAAAAVLDINKRVLYARNRRGRVVARQLVAVSEEGELVCFAVYPYTVSTALKRLFRDADRLLAQTVGLKLYTPPEEGPDPPIASILSQEWWNDIPWDFSLDE